MEGSMDPRFFRRSTESLLAQRVSRRTLLAAVPGAMLLAAGVACGDDEDDPDPTATTASAPESMPTTASEASPAATEAESGSTDGEWTFTDDRGTTITLPQQPERVVSYVPIAASLWDFGVRPVGVFGTTVRADGTPEITSGDIDFDTVESLGEVYGEMDLEALVALQPDLILYDIYGEFDLWGLSPEAVAQVEAIAPIAGISFVNRPVDETIGKIEELAGLLGADLTAADVVEAKERFDSASEAVRAACEEKEGLNALFTAGWTDNFYVANPPIWTDLIYFTNLGLDIVAPEIPETELWETLSWEQANKYQVDLILNDARAAALTPEQLAEYPTWEAQPAVEAGQVGEWYTEFVPSYKGFAGVLESLAETIEASEADVV
jgi:iron complex transport system substrate-binding protein